MLSSDAGLLDLLLICRVVVEICGHAPAFIHLADPPSSFGMVDESWAVDGLELDAGLKRMDGLEGCRWTF